MNTTYSSTLTVTPRGDREIVSTRMFAAPRELVFEAWTKPQHVARWWGRTGSTLTRCEIDLRTGCAWRFVERQVDGNEYPFRGEYREIVPPERLVYTFIFDVAPMSEHESVVTMLLEEHDGKTTMTETSVFCHAADRDQMLESGMEEGAGETLDRLEELLQTMA